MNTAKEILEMVREGTISVEEGTKLLSSLEKKSEINNTFSTNKPKMLRILVNEPEGDNIKVTIPVTIIKAGLNIAKTVNIKNSDIDLNGVDFDEIYEAIKNGAEGEIVNINSSDGQSVKITVD